MNAAASVGECVGVNGDITFAEHITIIVGEAVGSDFQTVGAAGVNGSTRVVDGASVERDVRCINIADNTVEHIVEQLGEVIY